MEWFQSMEAEFLLFIQENIRMEIMDGFWEAVTFLGDAGWFWIALGVVLLIPKKTRKAGLIALLSMGVCALITNVWLKNFVARMRPYDAFPAIVPLVKKLSDYSFPSGHTTASFASAITYYRMMPRKYGIAALVLATLIAFSRLYVGVHYPTDVLGGFLVALAGSSLVYYIFNRHLTRE